MSANLGFSLPRERTCCFTGHRNVPSNIYQQLKLKIEDQIRFSTAHGITRYLAGGARGFDALAAAAVIVLRDREKLPIELILALPYPNQSQNWPYYERKLHDEIKQRADGIVMLYPEYREGCLLARNRFMADNSSLCVAYLTHNRGGTYSTVKYCERIGVMVVVF
ncbi:MAG: DUF1273 domain-containing protein [Oscillospiraceae bacterium]|jgi:uncharacterized phage-like protein YoqJ|nr:DUF1273 domain-containing protein [Oscillospiraceae bacterium]